MPRTAAELRRKRQLRLREGPWRRTVPPPPKQPQVELQSQSQVQVQLQSQVQVQVQVQLQLQLLSHPIVAGRRRAH